MAGGRETSQKFKVLGDFIPRSSPLWMTGTMWQRVCGPWSTANKKQGLQSYNHEELLSAKNLNKLGRECSALDDTATPAHTWILAM